MTKETISFVYVTYIRSTPEKVFEAITKPDIAKLYWGHENVSDWKPGSKWEHVRANDERTGILGGDEPNAPERPPPVGRWIRTTSIIITLTITNPTTATAPFAIACGIRSCPSIDAPLRARNTPPGCIVCAFSLGGALIAAPLDGSVSRPGRSASRSVKCRVVPDVMSFFPWTIMHRKTLYHTQRYCTWDQFDKHSIIVITVINALCRVFPAAHGSICDPCWPFRLFIRRKPNRTRMPSYHCQPRANSRPARYPRSQSSDTRPPT